MLDIRLEGKSPIYEQLFGGISQLISSGELKPDEKLPAVREVAKQLGINPNTVQKAYAQLEQAGLIYSMPAKGSYVSAATDAAAALKAGAVKTLESALAAAKKSGVTYDELIGMADKIWYVDRKGG
ncbi:MAG: GntR family transcriptional regulator [Oscillospiraceae bacterium]